MTSNKCSGAIAAPAAPADAAAGEASLGEAELRELVEAVRIAEAQMARAVTLAGRLAGSGVCERVEGLPLDLLLGLEARMTGGDRRTLVTAGEVLASMPATAKLFSEGRLSWGQVRGIVANAKRMNFDERLVLDDRVAATAEGDGGIDALDPDQLLWAIDTAAEELRDRRNVERSEARRAASDFVAVQARLDGGVELYARYNGLSGAAVLNALDAAAGQPTPAADPDHADHDDDDHDGGGSARGVESSRWTSRGGQYAAALSRIAGDWLGGNTGRPARPLLIAHVDLTQATAQVAGTVDLAVRGPLPRLTAKTVESLAASGDVQAVLFDGAHPLAVGSKIHAKTIPAATRLAVQARDRGCRFPGSQDPLAHGDIHHLIHRADGGTHDPANLIVLSRRFHTLVHRHDWTLTLNPATGEVQARRGQRVWRSMPHGTPLARPPDHPRNGPADGRDPPDPPADDPLPF